MRCLFSLLLIVLALHAGVRAEEFKRLPPEGILLDRPDRDRLDDRARDLQVRLDKIAGSSHDAPRWRSDVEVLIRAVRLALDQNLFFKQSEAGDADALLDEADRRLAAVIRGDRGLRLLGISDDPSNEPQLAVGGFKSRIDDSVQPYGLVVPAGYGADPSPRRIDVWLHGRGDMKTEIPFLTERMTKVGLYAPADTFVLHPFGRHCNAFKFAGETDVYEALDHLGTLIPIDTDRVAVRGFSMGGAGCWHLGVHDPGRWFAVNPGAGFVDTIVYQGWDGKQPPFEIDATRRKLLNWYDVLPSVTNLKNTRTVAYSGEVDQQKQAADRVAIAARDAEVDMIHVVGASMGHKVDPASASKIESILAGWERENREQPRRRIDFVTHTLRYNEVDWLSVTGLREHWTPGRVEAEIRRGNRIVITTDGVTRLKFDFARSGWPTKPFIPTVVINGQRLAMDDWDEAPGLQCELVQEEKWKIVDQIDAAVRKRPGLQGPIDDAFCDRFLFVIPSRPATHGVVQRWIDREIRYAQDRWKRLMRGEVRVVRDVDLTDEQIENCHLVCFGDFSSNRFLGGVAVHLPIRWTRDSLKVGQREFNPNTHAPVFCFPNPRNPDRYLVVNSGMTFREFSNVSNSRQIAMLPDWAVMDVTAGDDGIFAGNIVADGFFDENWALKP